MALLSIQDGNYQFGLGDQLQQQVTDETEEERRKRMRMSGAMTSSGSILSPAMDALSSVGSYGRKFA